MYVQTGGRGRENVGSCRRGSLTVRTILACSSLYRLGENYGQDSNKKDTTLSRLCFYLPYTSAFRQLHTYACVYIYIYRGKDDRPPFLSNGPSFHFPFISSRYQIIARSRYALREPMADFNFDDVGLGYVLLPFIRVRHDLV